MPNIENLKINNTCAFDVLIEIFSDAYKNNNLFKIDVDKQKNVKDESDFLNLISLYSEEGPSKNAYNKRFQILFELLKMSNNENGIINCESNPLDLLDKLIGEKLTCMTEWHKCSLCTGEDSVSRNYFGVKLNDYDVYNFTYLEEAIQNFLYRESKKCSLCNNKSRSVIIVINNYICLEVSLFSILKVT